MNTEYCNPNKLSTLSSSNVERIGTSPIAKRNPCTKLLSGDSSLGLISVFAMRIISNATITATKLTPFREKHQPSPSHAIANPAMAGPTTRAPLKIEEFSAMALGRSEEHTSELQSHSDLVCRLLLEKK